ncbi:MAG: FHA domain-containing protein [Planctomycetaceae bacterium]
MNTILVISDHRGTRMTVGEFPVVFGRDQSADVLLTNVLASRRHCEIARTDDGLVLRDLNSVNGTMLNGTMLNGTPVDEQILRSGDQFTIGTSVFDVESIGDARSLQSNRRGIFGGVAQMLRSFGRDRPSSVAQLASAVADADNAAEPFN